LVILEAAINDWFKQRLYPSDAISQPLSDDRCVVRDLRLREGEEGLNDLRRKVRQDLATLRVMRRGSAWYTP
jgi:dGTPase